MPFPDKIQNAPELGLGLELYYGAFLDLNSCRPMGMGGVYPIPWTSIKEYATVYEFDEDQTEALFFLIRHMDKAFIEHSDKQQSKSPTMGKPRNK